MAELVADYVLKRLREWGVHRIYGYPGDGINAFLGALDRADGDPEFIQARHEEMAAFMACGHAKFAGPDSSASAWRPPGPGADPPPERPLRREARPRPGRSRSSASRSACSLGAHYQQEIDLQVLFKDVVASTSRCCMDAGAGAAPRRPRVPDRARPARRLHDHRPERRRRDGGGRVAAARARLRLLERRLHAPARSCRRSRDIEHAAEILNDGREGRDARSARARAAPPTRSSASPSCSAPASRRRCSARTSSPTTCPYVTGSIGLLGHDPELRHDGGLRHAAHGRHELPVRGVPAEGGPGALRRDRHRGRHDRHPLPGGRAADRRREGDAEGARCRTSMRKEDRALARGDREEASTEWWDDRRARAR